MAREALPDLIMIDLSMPVLDGWGVFQQLRSDKRTAEIPCVAVTAHGDANRERALQVGFDEYISKPFRGVDLLETVARLLAARQVPGPRSQVSSPSSQVPTPKSQVPSP
jgi:two-component system, cell cycle response regulator DivK